MSSAPAQVRNVSDTACGPRISAQRSRGAPNALFRDPYAEKLGARRGGEMAGALPQGLIHAWAWVARTYLFDEFLQKKLRMGRT